MEKLTGKVAVITGGTSGLALATAKLFVDQGAYVFITGRTQEKLDEALQLIGRNVTGVLGDAANLADLDRLYATVRQEKGKIDVLFASAGTAGFGKLGEITEDFFDGIFDLNVRGTLFTVQKALPLLAARGAIVLNGSMASIKGYAANSVYSASKAALRAFVRGWLVDLQDRHIRVNLLSPGVIDTPMMAAAGSEFKAQVAPLIPRGQMGHPEEVAATALFLASADASFINGIELFVDGGMGQI
ncbi:SDR family NAD(P)-dependent oxidoreductase [Hymenobacter wooponensis]|uniref:SDR family oxidoreductase n=1 Tax=Hymenobacter wooponensis TaxID=1525360 RepID=A0A4Z0MD27_9BACT|nr:SDR family oxidoreductase [Hymenobacter wooponensis]TGD77652.1 SDR family oxidoreductase [Hymenobacter wooponensis]